MLTLTCIACNGTETFDPITPNVVTNVTPDIRFVCAPCLFPTSLDAMTDRYADLVIETVDQTIDELIDDEPETITPEPSTRIMPKGITRDRSKVRLPELFKAGLINYGDNLSVIGHSFSAATVINAKMIRMNDGTTMTWNEYGQRFTGHKAVNIYKHILVNDVLLESLRNRA